MIKADPKLMIPDQPEQDFVHVNVSDSNLHIPEEFQSGAVSPRQQRQMYYDVKKELDIARIQAMM